MHCLLAENDLCHKLFDQCHSTSFYVNIENKKKLVDSEAKTKVV